MMGDELVINSYEDEIKMTKIKEDALERAGFDVITEILDRRGINTKAAKDYFNRIKNADSKEELDKMTVGELNDITDNLNKEITEQLISPVEISEVLVRKGRELAREMNPTGRVYDDDKYIIIGNNLGKEVSDHGIAYGVNQAIRNYCTQKIYEITYNEKVAEKERELGIEKKEEKKALLSSSVSSSSNSSKNKFLKEILGEDSIESSDDFETVKEAYMKHLTDTISKLKDYE